MKLPSNKAVIIALIISFGYYIVYFAYNATISKSNQILVSEFLTCTSNICVEHNDIRECIHLHVPMLFKAEIGTDVSFSSGSVKNFDFNALKEGCN